MKKDSDTITGLIVIFIPLTILSFLAFLLKFLYMLSLRDSFLWFIGVFVYFYVPGNLLSRYLNLNKDECISTFMHSLALGTAFIPLAYMVFRRMSHPELIYPFGIIVLLAWLILLVRDFKGNTLVIYTSYKDILASLFLLAFVFSLLHLSHFTDVVFTEEGLKIRNIYLTETVYHLGIVNTLKNIFPPLYPYAGGIDFSHYHLNMHLEIEMLSRLFSIDTIKLTFFYFPLLYFYLLVFVPYMFIRTFGNRRTLGILTGLLIFGSDLSFIPGFLGMFREGYPWTLTFASTIWSLFTLNGYLPSLFVLFLGVFYLKKFYEEGRLIYCVIFALLGFSAFGFKTTIGLHIMGAALLTGIMSMTILKDTEKGKVLSLVSVLTLLFMVLELALFRGNTGNIIVSFDFFNLFRRSMKYLDFTNMPIIVYLVFFPFYLFAAFGVRTLGFYFLKDVHKKTVDHSLAVFLIVFCILGYLISEAFFVGAAVRTMNEAGWFFVQSLMVAWLLLSLFLVKIRLDKKKLFGFVTAIIIFAAPTTFQFLSLRFDHGYYSINKDALEIVRYLETTPPDSVILHPPNLSGPSLASNLTGRPTVISLFRSFTSVALGKEEYGKRVNDSILFFKPNGEKNKALILEKYHVDYVYAPSSYASVLDRIPMLSQILKNSQYILYRVNVPNNFVQGNNFEQKFEIERRASNKLSD